MSRPDEGLIHAWLDGELDATEAARVEALVRDDPEWSAAAAEARGFIAASARIVGALDHVPAHVVPKAPAVTARRSRAPWWAMRAAAAIVIVAGTAVVLNRTGGDTSTLATNAPATSDLKEAAKAAQVRPADAAAGTALAQRQSGAAEQRAGAAGATPATGAAPTAAAPPGTASAAGAGARTLDAPAATTNTVGAAAKLKDSANAPRQFADNRELAAAAAATDPSRRDRTDVLGRTDSTVVARKTAAEAVSADEQKKSVAAALGAVTPTSARAASERVATSRTECYRESPARAGEVATVHRVMRTNDSTATVLAPTAPPVAALRAEADAARARVLPTSFAVRGDTLLLDARSGPGRIAIRISCPTP